MPNILNPVTSLQLFLPCAAGVEHWLAAEVCAITGMAPDAVQARRAGVTLHAGWREAMQLNLHSRLAQRVLVQLAQARYAQEQDLYNAAHGVAWEDWFTPRQSFKIEITSQHSPLKSLNFAALRIKDALADRFRSHAGGVRPDVDTHRPDVRVYAHLSAETLTLYIDTSGEPLFKRGWRVDKGDAPLKETLAAAMLAASGWSMGELTSPSSDGNSRSTTAAPALVDEGVPLYDPCCGSGTIAIEAAQIACRIAPGLQRAFGFERLRPFVAADWQTLRQAARAQQCAPRAPVFGSDVAHRMVDFAQRNAERAGVAQAVQLRGGDALQRRAPCDTPGVMLLNPPYGERIATAGVAGDTRRGTLRVQRTDARGVAADQAGSREAHALHGGAGAPRAREQAEVADGGDFFAQLATHWKHHYPGWTAWLLTPDLKLPGRMRFKESRRVPMWNGPIECRLFRFDLRALRADSA